MATAEAKALEAYATAVQALIDAALFSYCPWRTGAKTHSPDRARPCLICNALARFTSDVDHILTKHPFDHSDQILSRAKLLRSSFDVLHGWHCLQHGMPGYTRHEIVAHGFDDLTSHEVQPDGD